MARRSAEAFGADSRSEVGGPTVTVAVMGVWTVVGEGFSTTAALVLRSRTITPTAITNSTTAATAKAAQLLFLVLTPTPAVWFRSGRIGAVCSAIGMGRVETGGVAA